MLRVAAVSSQGRAAGDDREATVELHDRFPLAVDDPHGLGAQNLRVGVAEEVLRVLPGDLLERNAAAAGDCANTRDECDHAEESIRLTVLYAADAGVVTNRDSVRSAREAVHQATAEERTGVAATAERQQVTNVLLDEIEGTKFPSAVQMDRLERLISSREELEDYIAVLTQKVQETRYPDRNLLDRIERLLRVLRRVDEEGRRER